jgi:hypothetical protein
VGQDLYNLAVTATARHLEVDLDNACHLGMIGAGMTITPVGRIAIVALPTIGTLTSLARGFVGWLTPNPSRSTVCRRRDGSGPDAD